MQLEADGLAGPALDAKDPGSEMHYDAFVTQHLKDRRRDVGIFSAGELWSCLDDRHAAAEAAIGLCEFEADIAAANDDQMAGQSVELERLDIGERRSRGEAGNIRDCGMRPEIESDAITGQHARTAVVQIYLDGLRRNEPTGTHDQLGAAGFVGVEVHRDQAIDHVALACQHSLHIGGDRSRHHPEPIRVMNQIGNLCAPDFVLAGKTVGVRTGAADQFALDDRGAMPRLGHVPGQKFAACSATKDEHFVTFRLGHLYLLVVRDGASAVIVSGILVPDGVELPRQPRRHPHC